MFSAWREDWKTYDGDWARQGLWALSVYRFGRWRYAIRPKWLRRPFSFLYKLLRVMVQVAAGIDLPCEVRLGRRLRIEHFGAIIISGDTVIGDDVIVRQGVTLGLKNTGRRGAPTIGDRVDIGAGAKIIGPVRIGNDAAIGANAVVLKDVPDGCIAVGVPARILPRRQQRTIAPDYLEQPS